MTDTVKTQIQSLYKSGTRKFPAIMSAMKKAGMPVTMKEIGEALKEIRSAPAKKTKKGRKKMAKKKVSKKKAGKKSGRKHGPGRPKGSKNKKKANRKGGRKAGAGRKATGYIVTIPKGRGIQSMLVNGKPALEKEIAKLVAKGVNPSKIQVFQKISFKVETAWKIKV